MDLLINNALVATFSNTLNNVASNVNWEQFAFDFTASGPTIIAFKNASLLGGESGQNYVGLDNVSIAPVPLPNTLMLLLGGIGCLLLWGVRSRQILERSVMLLTARGVTWRQR